MKVSFKSICKNTILAVACFSAGFLGATQLNPAFAEKAGLLEGATVSPELRTALKNHILNRFFKLIDATEEQKSSIDGLVNEQMEYANPIREKMRASGLKIADMVADESVSDSELLNEIEKVNGLKDQIAEKRRKNILKIRSLLTKEQKEVVSLKIKSMLTGNPRLGLMLKQ